jgi:hypothetical protein
MLLFNPFSDLGFGFLFLFRFAHCYENGQIELDTGAAPGGPE